MGAFKPCKTKKTDRVSIISPWKNRMVSVSPYSANAKKLYRFYIEELGYERISSVASGNRAMMLLEGKGGAYIRDTGGFAKWDTSGPAAVLEAYGGTMSKLPPFLRDQSLESYTHLKSTKNLDFEPGQIHLTLSNAKDKRSFVKGVDVLVTDISSVKEYSCMQGLVALDAACMGDIPAIHDAMLKVKSEGLWSKPVYT